MRGRDITLSVVSHRQNALVNFLLEDVGRTCADRVAVVLTENVPDTTPLKYASLSSPVEVIVNERIQGFGANHNAAFARCRTPYFCVCNPDIRLSGDPFQALLHTLQDDHVGVVGPLVRSAVGTIEDSARRFPTVSSLTRKLLAPTAGPDYPTDLGVIEVDWVAGMFMLFRSEAFRRIGGFDEAYFLYYEDVDVCARLRKAGLQVVYQPGAEVAHEARRASRRQLRLALHHFVSMMRFLSRR